MEGTEKQLTQLKKNMKLATMTLHDQKMSLFHYNEIEEMLVRSELLHIVLYKLKMVPAHLRDKVFESEGTQFFYVNKILAGHRPDEDCDGEDDHTDFWLVSAFKVGLKADEPF